MRKKYTPEYKEYVAKLVVEEGRKATEVAHELEIPYGTLTQWTDKYRKKVQSPEEEIPLTPSEYKKKMAAYEKELRHVKEENDILKKAMHIFTKNPE